MNRKRVGILISGRGSNMSALIHAARSPDFPAEIALVLSNKAGVPGLDAARAAGVPTAFVDHKIYAGREEFERSMQLVLEINRIEIVCLAGFMRLLSPWFVSQWQGRMLNVHPSLLPSYKGLGTHERALAEGVKLHGCTVHFVVPELDSGPIIAQAAIPVLNSDTAASLAQRVLEQEHRIYPDALGLLADGRLTLNGNRVIVDGAELNPGRVLINPDIAH